MGRLSETLRDRGYRLTLQRELILDALEAVSGHIAVEDVYERVHAQFKQVNISTVYRTLELLEQEGLLTHTHFHDRVAKWHRAEEARHHHLICERCGAEQNLDLSLLAPLANQLETQFAFKPNLTHFAIMGLCQRCQEAAAPIE
jgi:Fur family ferric uptake transcriptional regulator